MSSGAAILAHPAAACACAGFQVTITALVHPQLAVPGRAAPEVFPAHEARHSARTALVVGPLFAALVGATEWLVLAGPTSPAAWGAAWGRPRRSSRGRDGGAPSITAGHRP